MKISDYQLLFEKYPDCDIFFGNDPKPVFERLMLSGRIRRIALFTGRNSVDENGVFARFARFSANLDIALIRFKDIPPEPTVGTVGRMVEFLRTAEADAVVALGGGSVMDGAKAAFLVHQAGGCVQDYFGSDIYSRNNPDRDLQRVICIPTTAGTGSEVTPYANIVDESLNVKKLISDQVLIPAHSFVVPFLTDTMPRDLTLAAGCDALAHLLEGFLNIKQDHLNENANDWALQGIRLIVSNLRQCLDAPTEEARMAVSAAATLGGMVIRYKSTGLPHLCSFSWYGIVEHGMAVILLLPAAWLYYLDNPAVAERTMLLKDIFPGATPDEVVDSFRKFVRSCGVPSGLNAYPALTPEILERTARSAGANPMKLSLAPRPVPPDKAYNVICRIIESAKR